METIKKIKLVESQYFPCVGFFLSLINASHLRIEACENFQKASFRNRCMVASTNGLIPFSVPLKSGREQKLEIREVEVDYSQSWQRQHWRTIVSCYRKAPFFDYYQEKVEELIFSGTNKLFDLNISVLEWLLLVLKIPVDVSYTTVFQSIYKDSLVEDERRKWLPKNFQDQRLGNFPKYSQVFEEKIGFQPNLSILDLLFCEGPNAKNVLLSNV